MKTRKIIALLLSAAIIIPTLSACSGKQEAEKPTEKVVEVKDTDDGTNIKKPVKAEKTTLDLTDNEGNVLSIVPVYNVDGATMIAGYVESARDKESKALDEKQYSYIKKVVGVETDANGESKLMYDDSKKLITLNALADNNGFIVAMQDAIDIDNDKDVEEYFKVMMKVDSSGILFIKLDKDKDGKPINVTVSTEKDGKKKVTTDDGKTVEATKTEDSKNIEQVAKEEVSKKKEPTTKKPVKKPSKNESSADGGSSGGSSDGGTQNGSGGSSQEKPKPADPEVDYVSIVLLKNGKVQCDAKNVTVESSVLDVDAGTEVVIDGAGPYNKYYVTSQTDTFLGHLDFRFSVGDDVEVKFNDVNITTKRKTAVKFTNVDKVNDKKDDVETGADDQVDDSLAAEAPAPKVDLSFTGDNHFKAMGVGKNGTIYSECRLDIKGHGSAIIDGGPNLSGICSTESIDIRNATLDITSKAKQGISCDRKVTIEYGTSITINSLGDGIHCNKFEMCNENEFKDTASNPKPSKIQITSDAIDCKDGIDSNDYIIISGGILDIVKVANGTEPKYGLKVRKVNKGGANGKFEINGGTVTSSAHLNTIPTSGSKQKTLHIKGFKQVYSIGNFTSPETPSYLCSPCNVESVSMLSNSKKQTTYTVAWSGNVGTIVGKK